ncbi:MAG: DUF1367 family protein [Desulfobulbaceae bacterium]|nr:DUF1367 family protein [Desulfobulbaceae bacterium]
MFAVLANMKSTVIHVATPKLAKKGGWICLRVSAGKLKPSARRRNARILLNPLKAGEIALLIDDKGQMLPADGESANRYLKLLKKNRNTVYIFRYKISRNYRLLQKYFTLLNTVYDAQEFWESKEGFRAHTLLKIGHSTRYINPLEGQFVEVPKTISFDGCTEHEFQEIYKKTLTYLMETYCFGEELFNKLRLYE